MIKLQKYVWSAIFILLFSIVSTRGFASPKNMRDNAGQIIDFPQLRISDGQFPYITYLHKFGRNPDIDTASGFEAIWNSGGLYSGFNATAAEAVETLSGSALDAGTVLSSGTATGGSATTLIDTGATFSTDTVAAGDLVIDDTQQFHGIVKSVDSETQITVHRYDRTPGWLAPAVMTVGDTYRVVTAASTGLAAIKISNMLDGNFCNETSEYVVLNGITGVDTIGSYRRASRVRGVLAGSGGGNAGIVTVRQKVTTANIFATLSIGSNATTISAYTMPCDKEGYISKFFVSVSGKVNANSNVRLRTRHVGEPFVIREELSVSGAGTGYVSRIYNVLKNDISPATDIVIEADTDTNDTGIAAGFDFIITDED